VSSACFMDTPSAATALAKNNPRSITLGCVTLGSTIATVIVNLSAFICDIRDSQGDIIAVSCEMHNLRQVLESLEEHTDPSKTPSTISPKLQEQISSIIANCSQIVEDVNSCVQSHTGSRVEKGIRWVAKGKAEMAKLRSSLEAHKTSLTLALDIASLWVKFPWFPPVYLIRPLTIL
jgi:hypothetical protein